MCSFCSSASAGTRPLHSVATILSPISLHPRLSSLVFLTAAIPRRALIYMIPATPPPPLILLPPFWKRQRRNIRCEILALSVRAVVFWLLAFCKRTREVPVQLTVNEALPDFLQFLAAVPLE